MGSFYEKITLKNARDVGNVGEFIKASDVREIEVEALVDTGAITLVINEETRLALGLKINGTFPGTLADGVTHEYNMAEAVKVCWKDRWMVCAPVVVPNGIVLLGAIPLENMDLMPDVVNQCLVGVHGDQVVMGLR
jgi:hypothetical protein